MDLLIIAAIFFVIALVVRRKEAFQFRWQPTRHTWVAVGTGLLAFAFSALLLLFEDESVMYRIILYGLIVLVCGCVVPWGYTLLCELITQPVRKPWQWVGEKLAHRMLEVSMILGRTGASHLI
jgi:hypothetical protein